MRSLSGPRSPVAIRHAGKDRNRRHLRSSCIDDSILTPCASFFAVNPPDSIISSMISSTWVVFSLMSRTCFM